jgi:hypothetical protein
VLCNAVQCCAVKGKGKGKGKGRGTLGGRRRGQRGQHTHTLVL